MSAKPTTQLDRASAIILTLKGTVQKLEKKNQLLVEKNKQLTTALYSPDNDIAVIKRKAKRYDLLLKKYQHLLVENKIAGLLMEDVNIAVKTLLR